MDHLADLIKPPELPGTDGGVNGSFFAHRLAHDGTGAGISQGCVVATALGRRDLARRSMVLLEMKLHSVVLALFVSLVVTGCGHHKHHREDGEK